MSFSEEKNEPIGIDSNKLFEAFMKREIERTHKLIIPDEIKRLCYDFWFVDSASFETMKLRRDLLKGIFGNGWAKPSQLQQKIILPLIEGKDVIINGQAGTGKSGSHTIACLERINYNNQQCQVLIISHWREICRQISTVLYRLGSYMIDKHGLTIHACIENRSDNILALKEGRQIVLGTPTTIKDMISTNALELNSVSFLILDEADDILARGFKDQMYDIYNHLPSSIQVSMVSSTMPAETRELAEKFMSDPIVISVRKPEITLDAVKQYYIAVEKEEFKLATLLDLYEELTVTYFIIYVNTRRKAMWLQDKLKKNEMSVTAIHGDMYAKERELNIREFRNGLSKILIMTDIRTFGGHGISNIPLVINYDLPKCKETYIHRFGRRGRYGRKGYAINLVPDDEEEMLRVIEEFYDVTIDELPMEVDNLLK